MQEGLTEENGKKRQDAISRWVGWSELRHYHHCIAAYHRTKLYLTIVPYHRTVPSYRTTPPYYRSMSSFTPILKKHKVCDPFGTPFLSHGYISLFFNKRYIFKWLFFHCHASSAGGIYILHVIPLIFICDLLYDEDWIIEGFSSQNGPLHGQQAIPVKVPWSMMHIQSYACIFVCIYGWRSEFPVSRVAWTKNS